MPKMDESEWPISISEGMLLHLEKRIERVACEERG